MPWNETTRREYARHGRRYASDLTDREWALVAPFLPGPKKIGRPRTTNLRDVWDATLYMASTGCQWAFSPNDFPPPSTVQRYFYNWLAAVATYLTRMRGPSSAGQPGKNVDTDDDDDVLDA